MTITNLDTQSGTTRIIGSRTTWVRELEADYDGTSQKRETARVSTNSKLSGTNKVMPPLETPLVDNGASMEDALTRIVDTMGEQSEQMSIRMLSISR